MTKSERWVWGGVTAIVVVSAGISAATGGDRWWLVFVPFVGGLVFWSTLAWLDRRAAEGEKRRDG